MDAPESNHDEEYANPDGEVERELSPDESSASEENENGSIVEARQYGLLLQLQNELGDDNESSLEHELEMHAEQSDVEGDEENEIEELQRVESDEVSLYSNNADGPYWIGDGGHNANLQDADEAAAATEDDNWAGENLFVGENVEADQFKLEPEDDQLNSLGFDQNVNEPSSANIAANTAVISGNSAEALSETDKGKLIMSGVIGSERTKTNDEASHDDRLTSNNLDLTTLSKLQVKLAAVKGKSDKVGNTNETPKTELKSKLVKGAGPPARGKAQPSVRNGPPDMSRPVNIREPSPSRLPLLASRKQPTASGMPPEQSAMGKAASGLGKHKPANDKKSVIKVKATEDGIQASSSAPTFSVRGSAAPVTMIKENISEHSNPSSTALQSSVQPPVVSNAAPKSAVADMQDLCGHLRQLSEMSTQAFGGGEIPSSPATPMKDLAAAANRKSRSSSNASDSKQQAGGGEEDDLVSLTRKLKDYQGYQPISDVAAVAAENTELKDALEKECWKRKHCEKQIQQLQNKLLELQQQLAVAMAMDSKKRQMTDHLDKTLAQVVDNWKKQEAELKAVTEQLRDEKALLIGQQQKTQASLAQLERDLAATVDELTAEKLRSSQMDIARRVKVEEEARERKSLVDTLHNEKQKAATIEKEKSLLVTALEQSKREFLELQQSFAKAKEEWDLQESDYIEKMSELTDTHVKLSEQDKARYERQNQLLQEAQKQCSSLQRHSQQLEIDLDLAMREKESLKVEMGILEAKMESSLHHLESDLAAKAQAELVQRLEETRHQHESAEAALREHHRLQLQQLYEQHRRDAEAAARQHRDEMLHREDRMRAELQEYADRLDEQTRELSYLKTANARLESQHVEMTSRLKSVMQTHCNEVLRLVQVGAQANSLPLTYEASLKQNQIAGHGDSDMAIADGGLQLALNDSRHLTDQANYGVHGSAGQQQTSIYGPLVGPVPGMSLSYGDAISAPSVSSHSQVSGQVDLERTSSSIYQPIPPTVTLPVPLQPRTTAEVSAFYPIPRTVNSTGAAFSNTSAGGNEIVSASVPYVAPTSLFDARPARSTVVSQAESIITTTTVPSTYIPSMSFMPIALPSFQAHSGLTNAVSLGNNASSSLWKPLPIASPSKASHPHVSATGVPPAAVSALDAYHPPLSHAPPPSLGGNNRNGGSSSVAQLSMSVEDLHRQLQQQRHPTSGGLNTTSQRHNTSLSSDGHNLSADGSDFGLGRADGESVMDYSHLSSRVEQHQARQEELKRFIQTLLSRPPGSPFIEGNQTSSGTELPNSNSSASGPNGSLYRQYDAFVSSGQQMANTYADSTAEMSPRPSKGPRNDGVLSNEQLGDIQQLLQSYRTSQAQMEAEASRRLSPGDSLEGAFHNRSLNYGPTKHHQPKSNNSSFSGKSNRKARRNMEATYKVADPSAAKVDVRIPIGHGGVADISATSSKPPSGASKHKSSKHSKAAPAWK